MEFDSPEMVSVKPVEPLLVVNKSAPSFEVGSALTFKKDGVYLVTVRGNKITVEKWGE